MSLPFLKMNGLGNDFVIVPVDGTAFAPSRDYVRGVADRASGVGCDQFIVMERSGGARARMRIWNADGGEVEACGNATRCVAWLMLEASGLERVGIDTEAGTLWAERAGADMVTVDMGPPGLDWKDIPLAWEMDTREIPLQIEAELSAPGCVSMGNPHAVFFVPDIETAPVATAGPSIEHHWLFPQRANVGFAEIKSPARLRLKVWERGVGQTAACGTGACAAVVAAHRRGLTGRKAAVEMDGGELTVEWRESDGHVLMTGPVAVEFAGRLPVAMALA